LKFTIAVPPQTGPELEPPGMMAVSLQLQMLETWMPKWESSSETRVRVPA